MKWFTNMLGKGNKKKAGFTLIELMIVIIIVGILAAIAVPIYSGFVKRARSSEAKATVGGIRTGQLVYHAEHDVYLTSGTTTERLTTLAIDLSKNRWFKSEAEFNITWVDTDGAEAVKIVGKVDPITDIGAQIAYETGVLLYTLNNVDWHKGD